jgi:hypothetical protein
MERKAALSIDPNDYFVGWHSNSFTSKELLPANDSIGVHADYSTPLYRVLPKQYAEDWVTNGQMRLSPLRSYREVSLGTRHDPREGVLKHNALGNNQFRWLATPALSLSLSRFPLAHLLEKFQHGCSEECATVEIVDPRTWIGALDDEVRKVCSEAGMPVRASVADNIAYSDVPNLDFGPQGAAIHAAFLKPHAISDRGSTNQYWLEAEVRVLWQPDTTSPLDYLSVRSPKIEQGCRIIPKSELLDDTHFDKVWVRKYSEEEHADWTKSLGSPVGITAWTRGNKGNPDGDRP